MPILNDIYLYPVKSLAGIRVDRWPVDKNGLMYDRKWMLVDNEHRFLSQRRLPKMALIKTRIEREGLVISAPQMQDLKLELRPHGGEDIEVVIWRDQCLAKTVSKQANDWFSAFLEIDCHMVYQPDDRKRQVDQRYAQASDQTAFADGFPFLVVSEGSLNALNLALSTAMEAEIDMERFRPNLVITDCEAYAEDSWRRIRIGDIEFRLPKPCSRCSVPGIDPETALSSKEPLATLSRLRKWQNQVYFGQNALHDKGGELAVGTRVDIIETGPKQPPIE